MLKIIPKSFIQRNVSHCIRIRASVRAFANAEKRSYVSTSPLFLSERRDDDDNAQHDKHLKKIFKKRKNLHYFDL